MRRKESIQFVYGNNGYDPTKLIKKGNKYVFCNIERIVDRLNTAHEDKLKKMILNNNT